MRNHVQVYFAAAILRGREQRDAIVDQGERRHFGVTAIFQVIDRPVVAGPVKTHERTLEADTGKARVKGPVSLNAFDRSGVVAVNKNYDVTAVLACMRVLMRVCKRQDLISSQDLRLIVWRGSGDSSAAILRNRVGQDRSWVGLSLVNERGGDALGASVELKLGERTLVRRARVDGSYASAHDPRVLFGLGGHRDPVSVHITWPDGARQVLSGLELNRYHRIQQHP